MLIGNEFTITVGELVCLAEANFPAPFSFVDVAGTHWARQAIAFVLEHEIMTGTSPTTFAPDVTLNRAMVTAILWRMAGSPDVAWQPTFADVPAHAPAWYRTAVIWANVQGIVLGSEGQFDPYGAITREQFATMLRRYAASDGRNADVSAQFNLDHFTDADTISPWATDAMRWASYTGLITGTTETSLSPQSTATRAQCAMILMRFLEA